MRAPLLSLVLLLLAALPLATPSVGQQPPGGPAGENPLPLALGRYRLGMPGSELPPETRCRDSAARGDVPWSPLDTARAGAPTASTDRPRTGRGVEWCQPRDNIAVVLARDTVAAIWVFSVEPWGDLFEAWCTRWMPRGERLFGRAPDPSPDVEVACSPPVTSREGQRLPMAADWTGPARGRRASFFIRGFLMGGPPLADGSPSASHIVTAFVLQCRGTEQRPLYSAACVAEPTR